LETFLGKNKGDEEDREYDLKILFPNHERDSFSTASVILAFVGDSCSF